MFTVEEAEKKWCPYGDVCCADKCMAWRWINETVFTGGYTYLDGKPYERLTKIVKNKGYCGLAGKPE